MDHPSLKDFDLTGLPLEKSKQTKWELHLRGLTGQEYTTSEMRCLYIYKNKEDSEEGSEDTEEIARRTASLDEADGPGPAPTGAAASSTSSVPAPAVKEDEYQTTVKTEPP